MSLFQVNVSGFQVSNIIVTSLEYQSVHFFYPSYVILYYIYSLSDNFR